MSPRTRREYVHDMRRRYAAATVTERRALLDEVVAVTAYHRKYAIALLNGEPRPPRIRRRRAVYGPAVLAALVLVWKTADYPWSARLKAMLPQWLPWLRKRFTLDVHTEAALRQISARSIDRLLRAKRGEVRRRLYGHTRSGALLKHQIPIRAERWDVSEPGWSELDTVAHCGEKLAGEFINSVNLTDIASTWTETRAICGKGELATVGAIDEIRRSLPFELRGIDSDSGSEFINHHCVRYCSTEPQLVFTRSRPYKKNDNAHIEQKNWTHVRKIFGWQRFEGATIAEAMNDLYRNELRIWLNYFLPSVKLKEKKRIGSRVRKYYDAPQTPFDRLIAMGALSDEQQVAMLAERSRIDPFALAQSIERTIAAIASGASAASELKPSARRGFRITPLSFAPLTDEHVAYLGGKISSGATRPR